MATWSIEHIPAAGGASTFASLATWGLSALQMQFVNWGVDRGSITARGGSIAFDAAQFGYKDKIVVWRDGVRFAHFWVTGMGATAQQQESRTYTLSGPSWWLAQLPFRWPFWPAKSTIAGSSKRAGMWLDYAFWAASEYGAPIGREDGTPFASFGAPASDLSASRSCLEVVQRAARVHPMSSGTWDPSGEVPIFIARTRSEMSTQDVQIGAAVETFGLTPLPEIQALSVAIRYVYGENSTDVRIDYAGADADLVAPNRLHITVGVESSSVAYDAASMHVAAKIHEGLGPLAWSGALNFHETETDPIPEVRVGRLVNLLGARAEWESMNACVQSVDWSVTSGSNDLCSVTFGAPDQLGVQDFLEFASAGYISGGSAGGNPGPYDPPTPPTDQLPGGDPGTYDDLNGTTGGGTPEGIVAVQARGGSWSLVGLAEYGTPSTPPRRFCSLTWAGSHTISDASVPCSSTATWSGVGAINPSTLATTSTHTRHLSQGGCISGDEDVDYAWDDSPSGSMVMASTCSATSTVQTCTPDEWFAPAVVSGTVTATLGDEDTDDSAIGRMLSPAEWGGATTAIRTVRTTGITGLYRDLRYRTEHTEGDPAVTSPTLIGLSPWQRYKLTVTLESRPVDSAGAPTGDWAESGTRTHYILANLDGEGGIDWQVVEPTAGYETRIASTIVEAA